MEYMELTKDERISIRHAMKDTHDHLNYGALTEEVGNRMQGWAEHATLDELCDSLAESIKNNVAKGKQDAAKYVQASRTATALQQLLHILSAWPDMQKANIANLWSIPAEEEVMS